MKARKHEQEGERTIKGRRKNEYTRTHRYVVPGTLHATCYCLFEINSITQHGTAPHRRARHGTARRCTVLLRYCWTELSWRCSFVIQQYSTYKPGVVVTVPDMILRMIPGLYKIVSAAKHAARQSTAQQRTVPHRTTGHGTARHRTAPPC